MSCPFLEAYCVALPSVKLGSGIELGFACETEGSSVRMMLEVDSRMIT